MLTSLSDQYSLCAGSVTGREHLRTHRNNQDGAAIHAAPDLLIAAVTDGCSSGGSTEVGARFGAAWLARWVPRYACETGPCAIWISDLTTALVGALGTVARRLAPSEDLVPSTVNDFLLFSFLVIVVSRTRTVVFGAGDGVFSVNGTVHALDAGPANAPAYVAYALLEAGAIDVPRRRAYATVHYDGPTNEVESALVATDGALDLLDHADGLRDGVDLAQFERDARYSRNASLVQKRLVVLRETQRVLADDTTIALLKRREVLR